MQLEIIQEWIEWSGKNNNYIITAKYQPFGVFVKRSECFNGHDYWYLASRHADGYWYPILRKQSLFDCQSWINDWNDDVLKMSCSCLALNIYSHIHGLAEPALAGRTHLLLPKRLINELLAMTND